MDSLSIVSNVKHITFGLSDGSNALTKLPLYRSYAIFRLPNIKTIDGAKVLVSERKNSLQRFSLLRNLWKNKSILLTRGFSPPILDEMIRVGKSFNLSQALRELPREMGGNMFKEGGKTKLLIKREKHQIMAEKAIREAVELQRLRVRIRNLWSSVAKECIAEAIDDMQNIT